LAIQVTRTVRDLDEVLNIGEEVGVDAQPAVQLVPGLRAQPVVDGF